MSASLQRALARLHGSGGGHDDVRAEPAAAAPPRPPARAAGAAHAQQHLVAVGGEVERRDAVGEFLALARLQVEARRAWLRRRPPPRPPPPAAPGSMHEENAGASGFEPDVGARGKRQRDDALLQLVEIDAHRLGRSLRDAAAAPAPAVAAAAAAAAIRRGTRRAFLIALRRQRRRDVVGQHRQVDAAGDLVLVAAHVEPAGGGRVVGAGREIQILPVAVEHRTPRVAHAVGDLHALAGLHANRSRWRAGGWAGIARTRSTSNRRTS